MLSVTGHKALCMCVSKNDLNFIVKKRARVINIAYTCPYIHKNGK